MAQLQSTNVTGVLCVNGVAVGGAKDFKYCCITTTGNWTPSSDLADSSQFAEIHVVGAGGGSGAGYGAASSEYPFRCTAGFSISSTNTQGKPGAYCVERREIDSTNACSITIGAGGAAGTLSASYIEETNPAPDGRAFFGTLTSSLEVGTITSGQTGGDTTFDDITANGGAGGDSSWGVQVGCRRGNASCPKLTFSEACNNDDTFAGVFDNFWHDKLPATCRGYGTPLCGNTTNHVNPYRNYGWTSQLTGKDPFCAVTNNCGAWSHINSCNNNGVVGAIPGGPYSDATDCSIFGCFVTNSFASCGTPAPGVGFGITACCTGPGGSSPMFAHISRGCAGNDGIVLVKWYE